MHTNREAKAISEAAGSSNDDKRSLIILRLLRLIFSLIKPLDPQLKAHQPITRDGLTLRKASALFLTFLLLSLSTYFLDTWVPHCLTTSSSRISAWYRVIRILEVVPAARSCSEAGERARRRSIPPRRDFWCFSELA